MKKYLIGFILLFLVTTILAYSTSMRGSEGVIDYIGNDLNIVPSKIKFSIWDNGIGSIGGLEVIGKTNDLKRVVLIARFNKSRDGVASYYKQGEGKAQRYNVKINYIHNPLTKLSTITGTGEIDFKISNIKIRYLNEESINNSEEPLPEPIPEPEESENHDVSLVGNYDGFGHVIRLKDSGNNVIEDEVAIVDCTSEYDIQFLIENIGDFTEDVEVNLKIKDSEESVVYEDTKTKEDLGIGATTTAGNKNNFVFDFEPGNYVIDVLADIVGFEDGDNSNNHAQRQIEIVC